MSTAKAAAQELRLWDSNELPWSRMVLKRDCAVSKSEVVKLWVGTSFPQRIQVCVGEDLAFLIVDLTFQGQYDLFQVQCQLRSSGGFACLGSHPGLANCTGASIEGAVARCTGCSSKRCPCRLSHLGPDLYSKGGCTRITTLGQQ